MSKHAMEWIDRVVQDVAELSDRNSPEDWPEAMLVTGDELRQIIERRAKEAIKQHDAEPVAWWNGKGSIIPAEDVQYLPNWTDYYPYPLFASPQPTKGEQ